MRPTLLARTRLRAAHAPQGAASSLLRLSAAAGRLPSAADLGEWAHRAARAFEPGATPAKTAAA